MENKKDIRFKKIATRRTQQIIDTLKRLSNCANTNNYSYTDKEVNKIFRSIEDELKLCKAMFKVNKNSRKFEL